MSIVNVNRDAFYIDNPIISNDWSTPVALPASPTMTLSPLVREDYNTCQANWTGVTLAAGEATSIGVAIRQPIRDRGLYRIKASAVDTTGRDNIQLGIAVGYPATTLGDGINTLMSQVFYIPFESGFDNIICLQEQSDGDAQFGKPVMIGVMAVAVSVVTTATVMASISVQSLAVKPPTMQNAIS